MKGRQGLLSRHHAASGGSPWTFLFGRGAGGSLFGGGTSTAVDSTGANLIVAAVCNIGGVSFSDSKANGWTALTTRSNGAVTVTLVYCINPTVGAGHTFSVAGTAATVSVQGFNDSMGTPTFDVENGSAGGTGGTTSYQGGSITPANANSLIVSGVMGGGDSQTAYTVDSGLTIGAAFNNIPSTSLESESAYLFQSVAAAINPLWSWTGGTGNYGVSTAAFKP